MTLVRRYERSKCDTNEAAAWPNSVSTGLVSTLWQCSLHDLLGRCAKRKYKRWRRGSGDQTRE